MLAGCDIALLTAAVDDVVDVVSDRINAGVALKMHCQTLRLFGSLTQL